MGGIVCLFEFNWFIVGGIFLFSGYIFVCMGEILVMGLDECMYFMGFVGVV